MPRVLMAVALFLPILAPGCSKKSTSTEHRTLEGVIEQIDRDRGEITMRYFNEKRQEERPLTGKVTPDTEIEINGVISKLADLRVGDRVTATGKLEAHGQDIEVVAQMIRVQRAETIRREPSGGQPHATSDEAGQQSSAN